MASIIDVAKYILDKCGSMTTMKLQKLCYYSQAWFLAWNELPMFDEDFEAWANGPVCPGLFRLHRGRFIVSSDEMPQLSGEHSLNENEKETIDKVISYYGDKDAHWLSELTHKELPWKSARERAGAAPGEPCSEIVTKESMMEYYSGL